jgi:ribose 5-phosphate isomerase RpiB
VRIGIAADHGGFDLKKSLSARLRAAGYDVLDCGAHFLQRRRIRLLQWVAGVRAALLTDNFFARQPFGSS